MRGKRGMNCHPVLLAALSLAVLLTLQGGCTDEPTVAPLLPPGSTVLGVRPVYDSATTAVGYHIQMGLLTYSASGTQYLTSGADWACSDGGVATVNTAGLVFGTGPGIATITGAIGGETYSFEVQVIAAVLQSVHLWADPERFVRYMAPGQNGQPWAVAVFSTGHSQVVNDQATWISSNPGVATVAGGTISAIAPGLTTVTAALDGYEDSLTITVSPWADLRITTQEVLPPGGRGNLSSMLSTLANGFSGYVSPALSSSNPASVTIGEYRELKAVEPGSAVITATLGGVSDVVTVTVLEATALEVYSGSCPIGLCENLGATVTLVDSSLHGIDTRAIAWNSSEPGVAQVNPEGRAVGISPGTATLTGTYRGLSASTTINVRPVGQIVVGSYSLLPGMTRWVMVEAMLDDDTPVQPQPDEVSLSSSDPGVFSVDEDGNITGLALGSATLTATFAGVSGTGTVTVADPSSLTLSTSEPPHVGESGDVSLSATLSNGALVGLGGALGYASTDPSVAVAPTQYGVVISLGVGTATLTGYYEELSASQTYTVDPPGLIQVGVTPPRTTLAVGNSMALSATAFYSDGTTAAVTGAATWSSLDPSVATVSGNTVTAVGSGKTVIFASYSDAYYGYSGGATLIVP